MEEKILAAALKDKTGLVWSLPPPARHYHLFRFLKEGGITHIGVKQGFITTLGRFVDRREGFAIAASAKQLKDGVSFAIGTLYSEDMW